MFPQQVIEEASKQEEEHRQVLNDYSSKFEGFQQELTGSNVTFTEARARMDAMNKAGKVSQSPVVVVSSLWHW